MSMNYCPQCGGKLSTGKVEGEERIICSSPGCDYIYWNNPVPVVAALVSLDGNYIIARNRAWPTGIFSVITGYLERGEDPETAVIREVAEELGVQGAIRRFIGNYTFREKNQVLLCYEVQATGTVTTNHELAEIRTLSREELSAYDFHPLYITEKMIQDWKALTGNSREEK